MFTNPVEFILMFSTGFVASVLLVSGGAKTRRTTRTLDSMADLGVPAFARRRWIAAGVPLWEISLGVALLVAPGWYRAATAVLALGTFALFTVFLVRVLRRGDEVDCGCFGPLSVSDRVTGWTVARNAVLVAASAFIALTAPPYPSFLVGLLSADGSSVLAVALTWSLLTVAILAVAVFQLRQRDTDPVSSPSPLPGEHGAEVALEGIRLPDAELVSPDGVTVPLHALGYGAPVLLVFLSAECGKCAAVAKRLPEWQRMIGASVLLRVATSSRPDLLKERVPEALTFAYFGARSAKRALGVERIPSAVLLGGLQHPYVASPVAHREDEIDALVRGIVAAQTEVRAGT